MRKDSTTDPPLCLRELAEACFSFCFTIPPPSAVIMWLWRGQRGEGGGVVGVGGGGRLSQPPSHHHCGTASVWTRTQIYWITLLGFSVVCQVTFDLTLVSCRSSGWNSVAAICWHTNITSGPTCACAHARANTTTGFDKILKQGCWCGQEVCGRASGRDLSGIAAQPKECKHTRVL